LIWERDPASTDFIGRRATAETDLGAFLRAGDTDTPAKPFFAHSPPAGFLIEDPASGETHLLVEGLQPLTAQQASAGSGYYFVANAGHDGSISIPLNPSLGIGGAVSTSFNAAGGLSGFSVVLADGSGGETVILSDGD
jgi:hypothetical protein